VGSRWSGGRLVGLQQYAETMREGQTCIFLTEQSNEGRDEVARVLWHTKAFGALGGAEGLEVLLVPPRSLPGLLRAAHYHSPLAPPTPFVYIDVGSPRPVFPERLRGEEEDRTDRTAGAPKPLWELEGSPTVCVGNLPSSANQGTVRDLFRPCGEIVGVQVRTDGRVGAVAFVDFEERAGAERARLFAGTLVCGREIQVTFAFPRPPPKRAPVAAPEPAPASAEVGVEEEETEEKVMGKEVGVDSDSAADDYEGVLAAEKEKDDGNDEEEEEEEDLVIVDMADASREDQDSGSESDAEEGLEGWVMCVG